jgi:hypothetical protein
LHQSQSFPTEPEWQPDGAEHQKTGDVGKERGSDSKGCLGPTFFFRGDAARRWLGSFRARAFSFFQNFGRREVTRLKTSLAVETALTCHLVMPGGHPGDAFILETARELQHRFKIGHATLQIEISMATACLLAPEEVV